MTPPKPAGPDIILHDLAVADITEDHLAPALIKALAARNDPTHNLPIAYLKVLENPTIETYRQAFGPIFFAQDAATATDLKQRITDWLKRRKATLPLAAAVSDEISGVSMMRQG